MDFKPIKPLKNYELVMNQLKEKIRSGELPPGSRLASVVDLAASFGVGRSTVREALSALKAMGWVEIRQGGGTYVNETIPVEGDLEGWLNSAESMIELLEVRKVLETGCAALAAQKRTEADLRELETILQSMADHIDDERIGEQADVRFHLKIAEATHNRLLLQMMESLSQRLHDTMRESRRLWFYAERSSANRLLKEHSDILAAVRAGDAEQASAYMANHIGKVESVLRDGALRTSGS